MEHEHPLVFAGDGADPVELDRRGSAIERQSAALQKILKALDALPPEGRMRVIRAAAALYGVALP
jgi:hypothetical protein